jgi:Fur family ferric uptake transcriptional regulator
MTRLHEPVDDVIRAAGLRRTTPRALVLRTLRATRGHLTASQIFEQIDGGRPEEPIAVSTVYRALEALEAKGVVSALRSRNGETRYEWAPERPAHHHLICGACAEVVELDLDAVEQLATEIQAHTGFRPDIRHLAIDGVCEHWRLTSDDGARPRES